MKNMTAKTFETIIDQHRAIKLLTRMLEKNRLAHALLFTGIDGIGKKTVAQLMAMALNCRKADGALACHECSSCRKVLSGNHPDLVMVEPSGTFIKIEQIRTLQKRLMFAPVDGGRRIVIMNDAHFMKVEAANAMLKMLEEPPDNTHIVLTAPQVSELLPTIASRCQPIAFEPLSPESIAKVLIEKQGLDEKTASILAVLAKGSLGKALSTDAASWMAWRKGLLERLGDLPAASMAALFGFAEALAHDKDKLHDALDVIMIWYRDLMFGKFHPDKILNQDLEEEIRHRADVFSVDDLVTNIMTVAATQRAIWQNANRRLALDVMMMKLVSPIGFEASRGQGVD